MVGVVGTRSWTAIVLAGVYVAACGWALWHPWAGTLVLLATSPPAAALLWQGPRTGWIRRTTIGLGIDAALAGAPVVLPFLGDLLDVTVVLVVMAVRWRSLVAFVRTLPAGVACLALYAVPWITRRALGEGPSAPAHRGFWPALAALLTSTTLAAAALLLCAATLSRLHGGNRAVAVLRVLGYPWSLLVFVVAFFVPGRRPATTPGRLGSRQAADDHSQWRR
jgi:hypothetical protein